MKPDQAWQAALGQLQMEMPKSTFDSWVRDTELITLDDGVATIAAANAYQRDWLDGRLSSTFRRLLTGLLNCSVEVNFVVWNATPDETENDTTPVADETRAGLEISAEEYDSLYEQVVVPHRITAIPGYFRRWLSLLGPDLGWMYVAFRQAAYTAGGRSGWAAGRFSGGQIAALCGITERTFWNRIRKPETWQCYTGLVSREGGGEWAEKQDGHPMRLPARYRVAMTLPLTPRDTSTLRGWLKAQADENGIDDAFRKALFIPFLQLAEIAWAARSDTSETQPMTVRRLVRTLFDGQLPADQLDGWATKLQQHIMPQNDQIMISHFFLETILPWLGAGAAWVYALLRDQCWCSPDECRNAVTVPRGYAEIGEWLGISRNQTIYDWLREPIACAYLQSERAGLGAIGKWDAPRHFRVLLDDIPAEILGAGSKENFEQYLKADQFTLGMGQFSAAGNANFRMAVTRFSTFGNAIFRMAVTRISDSGNADFSMAVTRFSVPGNANFRVKALNSGLNSLNPGINSNPKRAAPEKSDAEQESHENRAGEALNFLNWDWRILDALGVNPATQKEILATGVEPWVFVSWLLYGQMEPGVEDPLRLAVKRTLERREGAGKEYDDLAHNPVKIMELANRGRLQLFCRVEW